MNRYRWRMNLNLELRRCFELPAQTSDTRAPKPGEGGGGRGIETMMGEREREFTSACQLGKF